MRRTASLLAIVALLFGQVGAQLHDLSHLKHELAVVRYGENNAPPLGHSIEVCVAYSFICSTISHASHWPVMATSPAIAVPVLFQFFLLRPARVAFLSRGPPASFVISRHAGVPA
jgi:hypothetical protein